MEGAEAEASAAHGQMGKEWGGGIRQGHKGHERFLGSHWSTCATLKVLYKPTGNWVSGCTPVITALWRIKQEDCKIRASLDYVASLYLKQNKSKQKKATGECSG